MAGKACPYGRCDGSGAYPIAAGWVRCQCRLDQEIQEILGNFHAKNWDRTEQLKRYVQSNLYLQGPWDILKPFVAGGVLGLLQAGGQAELIFSCDLWPTVPPEQANWRDWVSADLLVLYYGKGEPRNPNMLEVIGDMIIQILEQRSLKELPTWAASVLTLEQTTAHYRMDEIAEILRTFPLYERTTPIEPWSPPSPTTNVAVATPPSNETDLSEAAPEPPIPMDEPADFDLD